MMQHKLFTTSILALGLAGGVHAAELGDIAPRSYIGQPLAVDIELVALTPEEVAGLQARLAAADVYRGANVNMNPALSTVRMQVEKRGQKQVLHVTTTRAVDADYLHVYIELGVPGKQDVRLATVWLQRDPNPPPPAPVVVAAVPPPPPASAMTPAQAAQITTQARAARAAAAATEAAKPAPAQAPAPAPAPVPERAKPAPLPSVHEAETGKPGEVKAAGQARRIAGVLVAADGKPLKPSEREEAAEVPMSVAQALLPLAPLPLPKGVKRPAPASCAPSGISAKECVALDAHNTELASKLTELEGKLKALQGALGGAAPAAAAQAAKPGAPAASAVVPAAVGKNGAPAANAAAPAAQADAAKAALKNSAASAGAAAGGSPEKGAAKATATGAVAAAQAGGASSAGAETGGASGKDGHGGKDAASLASASMSAQGELEAHAAKAAAAGAEASVAASAASGEASAAASVPTKQVRVLPKLKYKKEKEKPAEQSSSGMIPLIAGGVGVLALLGGGFVFLRKRSAGKGPLKIWQGFRKKTAEAPATDAAAPAAESAPESVV